MNTISNLILNDDDFLNLEYNFQPELTSKLDEIDSDFTQEIINEIVLWKVNRYSNFEIPRIMVSGRQGLFAFILKMKKGRNR
jgi:hypothetical protein